MLKAAELRQKYLDFCKKNGHVVVPSSPLVPENDPTTLFTGSGMQPMINYLLGDKHPKGTRIADSQKCFRSQDIEEVGDNRHTTFFEMLGNWSLGDYFKKEQLNWYFKFLTEEMSLDPERLYVTVYQGNDELGIPKDEEAIKIWQELFAQHKIDAQVVDQADQVGLSHGRIFPYGNNNWWSRAGAPENMPVGEPGGPDSEVFYDFGEELGLHEKSEWENQPCHVNCDCGRFLEIGNSVFMQYLKTDQGFEPLPQKNIDFGGGLERSLAAVNGDPDVFKTDLFSPVVNRLENLANKKYETEAVAFRVIADHMRAVVMLIADGVFPGNKDQGYFVRRLLRRAVRYGMKLGIKQQFLAELVSGVVEIYYQAYPQVADQQDKIKQVVSQEEQKFLRTLDKGLKEFDKSTQVSKKLTAELAFTLYETYGFPLELSLEEAESRVLKIEDNFAAKFQQVKHQHADKSRTASAGKFKGGLQDHSEITVKFHTATHLIHAALRKILGTMVSQKGSNINAQRLRFDFTYDQALTKEALQQIEDQVNAWIKADLPVSKKMMEKQAALADGALAFFVEKYPDEVSVYQIGDDSQTISKEFCGGPHVTQTGKIGAIEIFKEKSAAAGVRRVYARLKK
ncbi:MAG: alanine--tRNA ligase [Patescibacteria group bacterium]